jgi:hypothetical protein
VSSEHQLVAPHHRMSRWASFGIARERGWAPTYDAEYVAVTRRWPSSYLRPSVWNRWSSPVGTARDSAAIALYCTEGME